VTRTRIV